MYFLEFKNRQALNEWLGKKMYRPDAEIVGIEYTQFGETPEDPIMIQVHDEPFYSLPDGQMNIHRKLLNEDELNKLTEIN